MSVQALQAQLRTLRGTVQDLPAEVFCAKVSQTSGSVGEHVRHALDHARAVLALGGGDELTYEARLRGTAVETDPATAAREIARICGGLDRLDDVPPDRPILLHIVTEAGRRPSAVTTTLGREIAYVIQHTIHHCALIAVLLERCGVAMPARFGYAPSTPVRS